MSSSDLLALPHKFDYTQLQEEYESCTIANKPLQLYLSSKDGQTYSYDYIELRKDLFTKGSQEHLFTEINGFFKGSYAEEVYRFLDWEFGVCRAMFMLMPPDKRAYSLHKDPSQRLHIPIYTNRTCKFIVDDIVYHMPDPGQLYVLNAQKEHTALNLGIEPRLHLVFCLKKEIL